MCQHGNAHGVVSRELRLGEDGIQGCDHFPQHGIGRHAAGEHHRQTRVFLQSVLCCLEHSPGHTAQGIGGSLGGDAVLLMELLYLILNAKVSQWIGIHLPMQGTWVLALVQEYSTF